MRIGHYRKIISQLNHLPFKSLGLILSLEIVLIIIACIFPPSFFFFPRRRLHTSWPRDWSSDVCSSDLIELVPRIVTELESFDPSLVHSAVPHHLVAELASRHVKVVLAGEGADELFAGYAHYVQHESGQALHDELVATLEGMHIGGRQRVDRMAAAHGIEPRVPFLDLDVVELALALPPEWKLIGPDGPAKWMLRRAFEGWLPDEVLWRRKEQFGEGTGMNTVLQDHYEATVSPAELERAADLLDPPLRSREELAYFRMFSEAFPGVDAGRTVGRFIDT